MNNLFDAMRTHPILSILAIGIILYCLFWPKQDELAPDTFVVHGGNSDNNIAVIKESEDLDGGAASHSTKRAGRPCREREEGCPSAGQKQEVAGN